MLDLRRSRKRYVADPPKSARWRRTSIYFRWRAAGMSDVIKFPPRSSSASSEQRDRSEPRSIKSRRRASRLGQLADAEPTNEGMLTLMHQALSWIQLAENEELLDRVDNCPVVLVVEDAAVQRFEAVSMIENAGFETLEAASA